MGQSLRKKSTYIEAWSKKLVRAVSSDIFLKVIFIVFIIEALFFAVFVKFGLPPDENYHFAYIRLFASRFPSPFITNQPGYDVVLEGARNPFFLYHYLLSFPYLLVKNWTYGYIFLRIINIGISFGSLFVVKQIADKLKLSKLVRNISLFMLCNTLMFVFISGSITYDNLFILICLLVTSLLLDMWKGLTIQRLLIFLTLMLAGCLVKVNFLPFAAVAFGVLASKAVTGFRQARTELAQSFQKDKLTNYLLIFFGFLAISFLFVNRYGVNLVRYGTYQPTCSQVRTLDVCKKNALFAREEKLNLEHRKLNMGPVRYAVMWAKLIVERTFGVFAHRRFSPFLPVTIMMLLYFLLGVMVVIRGLDSTHQRVLFVLIGLYLLILLTENYRIATHTGREGLAIHGRYAFNVLPLLYLLINQKLLALVRNNRNKALLLLTLIVLFTVSNIPTYMIKSSANWHRSVVSKSNLL